MPDDLYDRDILIWSRNQADLPRRLARGERVNGVDWDHVVEEIEHVGLSELNAVRSYSRQMLVHLLKIEEWPAECPFTLNDLLHEERTALEDRLKATAAAASVTSRTPVR